MKAVAGVTLRTSSSLRAGAEAPPLWPPIEAALQACSVPWEPVDEDALCPPVRELRWAYLEADFPYAPHRTACREGESEVQGTQYPLVLVFVEASAAGAAAAAMGPVVGWLKSPVGPFGHSRLLLLSVGARHSSLKADAAAALAGLLVRHGAGVVDVCDVEHAARYVTQCASSIAECRKRRVPSRFKVAGSRCQTLPQDPLNRLRVTWVSQLMQVSGVSEEMAKAVAGRHATPGALLEAVAAAAAGTARGAGLGPVAEGFLADLEVPIRGRKGSRRLGPVVSRRLFALFHPEAAPEELLL